MKDKISISIKTPCSADWDKMSHTEKGKFCLSCRKEVLDFTQSSDNQIRDFFIQNKGKVCGRFNPNQLKLYTSGTHKPSFLPLFTLLGLSFIVSPTKAQNTDEEKVVHIQQPENINYTAKQDTISQSTPANRLIITGFVYDKHSAEPLPGVSVYLKGTEIGATSVACGKFEVKLTEPPETPATLVFSYIGYERVTKEITLADQQIIDLGHITMNLDLTGLIGEVVVVNYNPIRGIWWKLKNLFGK